MKWEIVRNERYTSRDTTHRGICPRYNKEAEIFIHLSGSKEAVNDLQPRFSSHFKGCNLQKVPSCIDCPLMDEYKNSHDY